MVLVESSKVSLPLSLPQLSSLLYEPNSLSLALSHFDSSISLFPSASLPSFSFPSKPQLSIPPPCTSSSFIILQPHEHKPEQTVLFLVAGPFNGGTQILFRFYVFQSTNFFVRVAQVVCNQKGMLFDQKLGVLLDINHGVSVKVFGSENYFVLHCVSTRKIWVFGVRLMDGEVLKLMRCAVIDCVVPVCAVSLSFGLLMFGEENGVRVFNLRKMLKGGGKKVKGLNLNSSDGNLDLIEKKLKGHGVRVRNGVIGENQKHGSGLESKCNGNLGAGVDNNGVSVKQKFFRCKGDTKEGDAHFTAFKEIKGLKSTVKAVSIQALSSKRFIILDSIGDLHMLCVSKAAGGSNIVSYMLHLPQSMKVQKMASLPDNSSTTHTIWVSDGSHSLHMLTMPDVDDAVDRNGEDDNQAENLTKLSVCQAIFAAEKIRKIVPFSMNSIRFLDKAICMHMQFHEVAWSF